MNGGPTAERVYDVLKAKIMRRAFRPGDRLDPAVLGPPLASSVTPVRDALHLLTGEGLVEARAGSGFHVPALDEPGLRDLYDWSAELLALSIRGWTGLAAPVMHVVDQDDLADRTAASFLAIARCSTNGEHERATTLLNARLHPARSVEAFVLADCDGELDALIAALAGERGRLRRHLAAYHSRRRKAAAAIVRAVYRAD